MCQVLPETFFIIFPLVNFFNTKLLKVFCKIKENSGQSRYYKYINKWSYPAFPANYQNGGDKDETEHLQHFSHWNNYKNKRNFINLIYCELFMRPELGSELAESRMSNAASSLIWESSRKFSWTFPCLLPTEWCCYLK